MNSRSALLPASALSLGLAAAVVSGAAPPTARPDSRLVFERRILPLLRSPNPSTCSECHLSGVDLKQYVRPSEAATFAALRDQGLIDLKRPAESRLLRLIRMSRPETPLLTQKARQQEYAAFRDWIEAAAGNLRLRASKAGARVGPAVPDAVVRHARLDRVTASFVRNVWSQEGRCMGCHRAGSPENAEHVRKHGPRVTWFVPNDPEATMRKVLAQGLVNAQSPEKSLLLLKPLNRVAHGGGVKMLYGDTSYQMFRAWVEDYARSKRGLYRGAADLPAAPRDALAYTECLLRVTGAPAAWTDKNLRVDIFAFDARRGDWAAAPTATGERQIGKDQATNLLVFRVVPPGAERNAPPPLPPGRYLLKYYADTTGRPPADYRAPTDSPAFYQGRQEVRAAWKPGWGDMTTLRVALQK